MSTMSDIQAQAPSVIPPAATHAIHIGSDDLPFVDIGDGSHLQLLQVDLNQGIWVVRVKFKPGTQVDTHYHTGPVYAVTRSGRWFYKEYPEYENTAGSYLFEPAGSVHTLTVPADQDEDVDVWFAVYGSNVNMDENGQVISVVDAPSILAIYRTICAEQGLDCSKVIVQGG